MCGGYSGLSTVSSIHRVLRTFEEAVMIPDQHQGAARTRFGRATTLGPIALLAWLALMPAAAHAQATIAGTVRDTSGARAARRDGRGVEPGADREGPLGRQRRRRAVPHREPAAGHLHGDVHAAGFHHGPARGRRADRFADRHGQRRAASVGARRGDRSPSPASRRSWTCRARSGRPC